MAIGRHVLGVETPEKTLDHLVNHNSDNRLRGNTWAIKKDHSKDHSKNRVFSICIGITSLIFSVLVFELPLCMFSEQSFLQT